MKSVLTAMQCIKSKVIKDINKDKYYTLFITVICITALIVGLLQTVFTKNMYEQQSLNTYYNYSLNSLNQLKKDIEHIYDTVQTLAVQLSFSKNINQLIKENDESKYTSIVGELKNYVAVTPLVKNIYIYTEADETLFSAKTGKNINIKENFGDFNFKSVNTKSKYNIFLRTIKEELLSPNFTDNKTLTLSYCPDFLMGNLVLIDIDYVELSGSLQTYKTQNNCELLIAQSDGTKIFSSGNVILHDGVDLSKLYKNTQEQKENFYKVSDQNGKKYISINNFSQELDYSFYMLIDYKSIQTTDIMKKRVMFTCVSLILLIIGIAILYICIQRLYKPIKKMSLNFEKYKSRDQKKKNESILYEFLTGGDLNENKLNEAEKIISEELKNKEDITLIGICVDHYAEFCNQFTMIERGAYLYGFMNIFKEIIDKYYKNLIVCFDDGRVIMLVSMVKKEKHLEELLFMCQKLIKNSLEISVSGFIAEPSDFNTLNIAYEQVNELMLYKFVYGNECLLSTQVISSTMPLNEEKLKRVFKQIKENLFLGKFDTLEGLLKDYLQELSNAVPNVIISNLTYLLISLFEVIENLSKASNQSYNVSMHTEMIALANCETIMETENIFMNIFKKIEDVKILTEGEKHSDVTKQIYEQMDKGFRDPAFCADTIATELGFSTVYMCRVFKNATGLSLPNELLKKRLDESIKLLCYSKLSIKEIFIKCGFANSSYFSLLFKKNFGVTPSEYRKTNKKQ